MRTINTQIEEATHTGYRYMLPIPPIDLRYSIRFLLPDVSREQVAIVENGMWFWRINFWELD